MMTYLLYSGDGTRQRTLEGADTIKHAVFCAELQRRIDEEDLDLDEAATALVAFIRG